MAERIIRTKEERIAELNKKKAYHEECIKLLDAKIDKINNPPKRAGRRPSIAGVLAKAKENGMSPEDIAKKLGISFE